MIPVLLLRLYVRARKNRSYLQRWTERLGIYHGNVPAQPLIWIHAVSVGESMAAVPLIRALMDNFDEAGILVTTTTPTGAETIKRMLGEDIQHVYFPYDLPHIVRRFLERFVPMIFVVLETELWPNTFASCVSRSIPIVLANARLSERSLKSYARLPWLSQQIIRSVDFIAAQTEQDRDRFIALGAAPERIQVFGSVKFDLDLPPSLHEQAEALRRQLGVNRPILMAGSTRDGEERIVVEAFNMIGKRLKGLLLVLAPRHPERFDEVAEMCRERGLAVVRCSTRAYCSDETEVYLVDAMGELPRFYAASDVAFVGGSLLPYGGHNVLEPASLGTPVLVGPHTHNFSEICRILEVGGALQVVSDGDELARAAFDWLVDSNERDRIGSTGAEIVRQHRGATKRTVELIRGVLNRG
ncbi:MAG: lipid IV(A) 3-deoxy-D-manno-octulosonic acid transferase [Gammaproteobacteria bacterium]